MTGRRDLRFYKRFCTVITGIVRIVPRIRILFKTTNGDRIICQCRCADSSLRITDSIIVPCGYDNTDIMNIDLIIINPIIVYPILLGEINGISVIVITENTANTAINYVNRIVQKKR